MNNLKRNISRHALALALVAAMLPMAAMAEDAPASEPATAAATAAVAAAPAAESEASSGSGSGEKWDWAVTPYLWASSISTDIRKEGAPPVGSEVEFDDILSKLDMAFQIHVEGQGDRFGVFADLTYIALSDSKEHPVYTSEASIDTSFVEVAGVWNVEPKRFEGLDLFAGVRHVQVGSDVEFDPVDPTKPNATLKFDQSFTDFMVGARYNATLSDRWGMTLRGDVGWGDTEGDYSLSALMRYQMKKGVMIVGYRFMELEVAGASQNVKMTMSGPIFGYAMRF